MSEIPVPTCGVGGTPVTRIYRSLSHRYCWSGLTWATYGCASVPSPPHGSDGRLPGTECVLEVLGA